MTTSEDEHLDPNHQELLETGLPAELARNDELVDLMFQLTRRQAHWEQYQQTVSDQHLVLNNELRKRCEELLLERKQLDATRDEVEKQRRYLDKLELQSEVTGGESNESRLLATDLIERLSSLESREEDLEDRSRIIANREQQTRAQRKAISQQLRAQRAELFQMSSQLPNDATGENDNREQDSSEQQQANQQAMEKIAALQNELESAHAQNTSLQAELDSDQSGGADNDDKMEAYEDEKRLLLQANEMLRIKLESAQEKMNKESESVGENTEILDDFKRRIEMMAADLREAKTENENLLGKLKEAQSQPQPAPAIDGLPAVFEEGLDWETEKQRLIAAMEAEDQPDTEAGIEERATVEDIVRRTDEHIADKDEEIEELKKMLSHQSESIGQVAVGAAAISEFLDKDELIVSERENLQNMQVEWKEKLRKAEVEISVERAKLARQRAELEEKSSAIQMATSQKIPAADKQADDTKNSGRWLSRLGLRDGD